MPPWLPTSAGIAASVVATLALTVMMAPTSSDTVAVVFPPWWTSASVLKAAVSAGTVLDVGRWPATLIMRGERLTLGARLRAAGALIILDAGDAGGCRTLQSDSAS